MNMISADQILDEMKRQTPEKAEEIECMRNYLKENGTIMDYDNLPPEYKLAKH
jgi:hypothetical protein